MEQARHEEGFGLYDEQDGCWMGNTLGPYVFAIEYMAQAAAFVMTGRLGWDEARISVRPYDGSGTTKKDVLDMPAISEQDRSTVLRLMREDIIGGDGK